MLTIYMLIFVLAGCNSTLNPQNNKGHIVYSNYSQCTQVEGYKPLQVTQTNEYHEKSTGSAFYIGTINAKHIFITNAHLVFERNPQKYYSTAYIVDKNGLSIRAKVANIKEIRLFKSSTQDNNYTAHKIADIAILEVDKLPKGFAVTLLNLSSSTTNGFAFSQGINYMRQHWKGCFGLIHQNNQPYLYSEHSTAVESFSGTPVLNQYGQVIGMITSSGQIFKGSSNRKIQLYITTGITKPVIISTMKHANSKMIFAMLTPTSEIQKLLKETYGDVF